MKTKVFLFGLFVFSMFFTSCSADDQVEELKEIEQLETLNSPVDLQAIDKEEVGEDDT